MLLRKYWREVVALLIIGFCIAAVILLVFSHPNGRLSPDSTNYLRMAYDISQGNGLWRSVADHGAAQMSYMAIWPPGYPLAIAALTQMLPIDGFLASKLLSLICYLLSVLVLFRFFGRAGAVVALLMTYAGTLSIYSYSWSEGPFILFLLLFAMVITRATEARAPSVFLHLIVPAVLAFLLFELRYIGVFSIGVIGIAALLNLRRSRKAALFLTLAGVLVALLCYGHLQVNIARTGHATGMQRISAPETNAELALKLLEALAIEVVPLLFAALIVWLIAMVFRRHPKPGAGIEAPNALGFLLVGGVYLSAIVYLRWQNHFDPFGHRLLNPGVLLLLIYAASHLLRKRPGAVNRIFLSVAIIGGLSGLLVAIGALRHVNSPTYYERIAERLDKHAALDAGTIVVFGDSHLRYLRPDLFIVEPGFAPYQPAEPWDEFIARLRPGLPIVIDTSNRAPWREYHPAIRAFLSAEAADALIPLDDDISARLSGQ